MSTVAKLYVVATPIGNLGDITIRAITTLKEVQVIAAEDTRQSKKLLMHHGIATPLIAVHAHNEKEQTAKIINYLEQQQNVAYITDAGTPLISDPGAVLVRMVRERGFQVIPIPGPCAAVAALSVAGISNPQFYFEGFLPNKSSARKQRLTELKKLTSTLIFYESPHRIIAMLQDTHKILGNRTAVIARELTKKFETILENDLASLVTTLTEQPQQQLGEFVVIVSGGEAAPGISQEMVIQTLSLLMRELPLKKAVEIASKILELGKNELYQLALAIKE